MRFRDRPEFLRGRAGEERIAAMLKSRGWFIIPSYDYSGPNGDKAPKAQGANEGIVMPDLGMARAGSSKWAEVKAKWKPNYTNITQTVDHGIAYRHWCHYLRFQEVTGQRVWLFILEEKTQILRFQNVDILNAPKPRFYDGDRMDPGGMVFWPIERFDSMTLSEIPGLFDPTIPLSFERPEREAS